MKIDQNGGGGQQIEFNKLMGVNGKKASQSWTVNTGHQEKFCMDNKTYTHTPMQNDK